MGVLSHFLQGFLLTVLSLLTCNSLDVANGDDHNEQHGTASQRDGSVESGLAVSDANATTTAAAHNSTTGAPPTGQLTGLGRWVMFASVITDLIDYLKLGLNIVLLVKLFQLPDSIFYACLLLVGVILARVVEFRATNVLFRGGIDWSPFWIDIQYKSNKDKQAFALLYCLCFSETAVFLFEDYPSLVIYAFWPVINFLPAPLDHIDDYNVAIGTVSLCVLLVLFLVAIAASFSLLPWSDWTFQKRCINGTKIGFLLTCSAFMIYYVVKMAIDAVGFTFLDKKKVPSNKVLFIPLCDSETFETRFELCDERIFTVKVVIAWASAVILTLYLYLKPATYPVEKSFYHLSLERFGKTWTSQAWSRSAINSNDT